MSTNSSINFTTNQFLDLDWSQIIDLINMTDDKTIRIDFPSIKSTRNHVNDLYFWIDPKNIDDPIIKNEWISKFKFIYNEGSLIKKSNLTISMM